MPLDLPVRDFNFQLEVPTPKALAEPAAHNGKASRVARHSCFIDRKRPNDCFRQGPLIDKHNAAYPFFRICEVGAVDYCQRRSPQLTVP